MRSLIREKPVLVKRVAKTLGEVHRNTSTRQELPGVHTAPSTPHMIREREFNES